MERDTASAGSVLRSGHNRSAEHAVINRVVLDLVELDGTIVRDAQVRETLTRNRIEPGDVLLMYLTLRPGLLICGGELHLAVRDDCYFVKLLYEHFLPTLLK